MLRALVVDDDRDVADVVADALASRGFTVLTPAPRDALALADATRDPIDLLLTAVLMNGLNGVDLAESVRARWPRMRVLLMTGYSTEDLTARGVPPLHAVLLAKPLTLEALFSAVREVLGDRLPPA